LEGFEKMNGHPLMDALLGQLPEPGTIWPAENRRKWLAAATSILDLVYPSAAPGPDKSNVPKVEGPLTQSQQALLDFIASKSGSGDFAELSFSQLSQGTGVPSGSLAASMAALIQKGLIEAREGAEPRAAKSYRVPPV
jgi:hypothetical protein